MTIKGCVLYLRKVCECIILLPNGGWTHSTRYGKFGCHCIWHIPNDDAMYGSAESASHVILSTRTRYLHVGTRVESSMVDCVKLRI